jgi:hypothetical protein
MNYLKYYLLLCLVPLTGAVCAQQVPTRVTHYYTDDGSALGAEEYLREAGDPAKALATFWQVQLFREGTLERDSAWGAISGPDHKYVIDQYYRELDLERAYGRLFGETAPGYGERNYNNYIMPVAVRIRNRGKAAQCRSLVQELPGKVDGKLNAHIDFFLWANKVVEDNPGVLMSNGLRTQFRNYGSELLNIIKNLRSQLYLLTFHPDPRIEYTKIIGGNYQGKGGIVDALAGLYKLKPALQGMFAEEYDPNRPVLEPRRENGDQP